MEVLALIPARGGSKSIPKKNLYPILDKPLIAWTIEAALKSKKITRVIVSTDSEEIAAVARQYGAETPFLRPAEFAGDMTPDLPVYQQALSWLKEHEGYEPELVVYLWPTSPYRKDGEIDAGIEMLENNSEADAVRSVTEPSQVPFKMWRRDKTAYLSPIMTQEYPHLYVPDATPPHNSSRQGLPEVVVQTGYFAVLRRELITEKNDAFGQKVLPFYHDPATYTEFDSIKDAVHAEQVLKAELDKS